jgi:hypothetical protein
VFASYGTGDRPAIDAAWPPFGVYVSPATQCIVIDGLKVHNAIDAGISVSSSGSAKSNHVTVRNTEVTATR